MENWTEVGQRLSNWGRWGPEDQLGTLNLITAEKVVAAARLVRTGKVFDLGTDVGAQGPQIGDLGRINPVHLMSMTPLDHRAGGVGFCDDFLFLPLQGASQWDALAHCYYDGQMYNGYPISTVTTQRGASVLSIDKISSSGVTGRGVLLDVAATRGVTNLGIGEVITPADLEAAEAREGVRVGSGDILCLRTGWWRRFLEGSAAEFMSGEPGLGLACCEWLHEREVAALLVDNYAVEVVPTEVRKQFLPVHCVLIRDMGMTLGELADLERLALDCAEDGVYEFFFSGPPLKIVAAVGSPINPVAVK